MNIPNRTLVAGIALALASGALAPVEAGFVASKHQRSASDRQDCVQSPAAVCSCPASDTDASLGRFGIDLIHTVSGEGTTNALVSPFGIGTVLVMLAQGATEPVRGSIRQMLRDGAGGSAADAAAIEGSGAAADGAEEWSAENGTMFAAGGDPLDVVYCRLVPVLGDASDDDAVELRIANATFADHRLDIFPSFSAVLGDRFGARVERIDFASEHALERINAWVARQTEDAIPGLISHLEPDDALVLANAMHFRGIWKLKFDSARTAPLPFQLRPGTAANMSGMRAEGLPARYREDEDFQAVALPYGGGDFEAVVVLPREGLPPSAALRGLAADPTWLDGLGFRRMFGDLTLPRVTLRGDVSLLPLLKGFGLASAFDDANAFAGIAASPPVLSRVAHRTMLVLDEQGTEAAAATAAIMTARAAIPENDGFEMIVNRPFVLAVRHRGTGALLFTGWVADPSGG